MPKALGCIGGAGTALGLAAALAGVVIAVWVSMDPEGHPISRWVIGDDAVETAELPGDARAFDPVASLPAVQAYAGTGTRLVSIEVALVRADGTMDLEASYSPKPSVTYTFARSVERPADAPPPGAGGANTGDWYEEITIRAYDPGARRQVTTTRGNSRTTFRYTNKGMERNVADPAASTPEFVDAPACSIAALWDVAIAAGAPGDAVARIDYDADGYEFGITGVGVNLDFDANCALKDE